MARVQTPELGPPDPIRPAPLKGDTFVQAARPPIDNSLEQLQKGLSVFGAGLMAVAEKHDDGEKQRRMAEYQAWRASETNADQVRKIWTGEVPYYRDPYIGAAVRKDYGAMKAVELGEQIERDIASGSTPIGAVDFNIEKYLLERAAPTVKDLASSYEAIGSFRAGLDSIRGKLIEENQKRRGAAAKEAVSNAALHQFQAAVEGGIANGQSADLIMGGIRKLYNQLGPREQRGSLDLQYREMDQLFLKVLDDKAEDPRAARHVIQLLHANRVDEKTGTSLGPIAAIARHSDKVQAVEKKALGTLAKVFKEETRVAATQAAVGALTRANGEFSIIRDAKLKNPFDGSEVSISADTVKEDAVRSFLLQKPSVQRQLDVIVGNGVAHPVWIPQLKGAYQGFLNSNLKSPDATSPEQIQAIQEAAQLYNTLAGTNYAYTDKHLDADTRNFFERYTALVRYAGLDPREAAASMARLYSDPNLLTDPAVAQRQRQSIESAVRALDYSYWPWRGSVKNNGELEQKVIGLATVISQVGGISAADAVAFAKERVQNEAVYINGTALFGVPGLKKEDEPHLKKVIETVWEENKAALQNLYGVNSADDLTLRSDRNGQMYVVKAKDGFTPVLTKDGLIPRFALGAIQKLRSADYERTVGRTISKITGRRKQAVENKSRGRIRPNLPPIAEEDE